MTDAHKDISSEGVELFESDQLAMASDWSDYRSAYGVSGKADYDLFVSAWKSGFARGVNGYGDI